MSDPFSTKLHALVADVVLMYFYNKPYDDAETLNALAFADTLIRELELADTVRLLHASQVWIADAVSEDPSGEPWLMSRTLLNQLASRVDSLGGWADG